MECVSVQRRRVSITCTPPCPDVSHFLVVLYLLFCFHQYTPLDRATQQGHEGVVAHLKTAADPNMLGVCETVPFRIVVVSSGEALTMMYHSCHLFHLWDFHI